MQLTNSKNKFVLLLLLTFVLVKIFLIFFLGLNNSQGISYTWQVLDLDILKNDLLNSILYLHAQPPLWNLFVGILLKIFDGDTKYFYQFFIFYHQCLSATIIYIFVSMAYYQKIRKKIIFLLAFFLIILNPSIIYFEFLNYYAHTIFTLSCLFAYNFYLYLINKENKFLYICYLILSLKILIWSAYHPIILVVFFLFLQLFCFESRRFKNYIIFFLFLVFTLSPTIKNKIIYQSSFNSFLGLNLAMTVNGLIHLPECALGVIPKHSKKFEDLAISKIENKLNFNLKHPSIYGVKSKKNSIAMQYLSEHCTKKVLHFIANNPLNYLKRITSEILSTHGQFIFDLGNYIDQPEGWNSIQKITLKVDKNNILKLIRQIANLSIMAFIYIYLILIIVRKKNTLDKKYVSILFIIYIYILSIGTFISKYEGVRFIHAEYILVLVFSLYFFSNNHSLFKK